MSRRAEIFQRYQVEFQESSRRGRALHDEVLRQEQDVLATNVPAAKTALVAYAAAVAKAFKELQDSVEKSEQDLAADEAQLIAGQYPAELAAEAAWNEAKDEAALKQELARAQADETYDAAYREALRLMAPARDSAIAKARRARDAAYLAGDSKFIQEDDKAYREYQEAYAAARETVIAKIDGLRVKQRLAADAEAETYERGCENASARLRSALSSDPTAAAIHEAFQMRLVDVDRQAEADKQAILARMQAELAQATS